jgi:hypothetical protein
MYDASKQAFLSTNLIPSLLSGRREGTCRMKECDVIVPRLQRGRERERERGS